MGYRHYFYKLNKEIYNNIDTLTLDEFNEKYATITYTDNKGNIIKEANLPDVLEKEGELIFEFGKLYWDDTVSRIQNYGNLFFSKKELNDANQDFNAYIISEKGMLEAINILKEKVNNVYSKFLKKPLNTYAKNDYIDLKEYDDLTEKEKFEIIDNARDYAFFWFQNRNSILNIKPGSNKPLNSWIYEHELSNLISEYNHFDFEHNILIFIGW